MHFYVATMCTYHIKPIACFCEYVLYTKGIYCTFDEYVIVEISGEKEKHISR